MSTMFDDFELGFLSGFLYKIMSDSADPDLYEILNGITHKINNMKHTLKVLDEGPHIGVQLQGEPKKKK
jgi:hypothetical protein